jgi:hypothetical protein
MRKTWAAPCQSMPLAGAMRTLCFSRSAEAFPLLSPGGSDLLVGSGQLTHDGLQEGRLVCLEQDAVGAELLADLAGGLPLAVQGVGRDDDAVQVQPFQRGEELSQALSARC